VKREHPGINTADSPTSGGRSVGIVRWRTKTPELWLYGYTYRHTFAIVQAKLKWLILRMRKVTTLKITLTI
jgi:hypothetical protein